MEHRDGQYRLPHRYAAGQKPYLKPVINGGKMQLTYVGLAGINYVLERLVSLSSPTGFPKSPIPLNQMGILFYQCARSGHEEFLARSGLCRKLNCTAAHLSHNRLRLFAFEIGRFPLFSLP